MKTILVSVIAAFALSLPAYAADTTVTLTDVHLCCGSCVKGVAKAVADVKGLTATADQTAKTVTLTGPDAATVQKGADALVAAGYFGKSSDASIKVNAVTGAKNEMVKSIRIEDLHLCCGKCVKTVNDVLATVPGVKDNTAATGEKAFLVRGNFNDKAVFDALEKAGLTGKEK